MIQNQQSKKINLNIKNLEKIAVIYTTFFEDIENESYMNYQFDECMKKIKDENLIFHGKYEDRNVPLTSDIRERRGLMQLLIDAENKKFKNIVIFNIACLGMKGERTGDLLKYYNKNYNIKLFSCEENIDISKPISRLMAGIFSGIAELERGTI